MFTKLTSMPVNVVFVHWKYIRTVICYACLFALKPGVIFFFKPNVFKKYSELKCTKIQKFENTV